MFTFAQLRDKAKATAFPDGEAHNLVDAHNDSAVDGLVELQRAVSCLRTNHLSIYEFCSTRFNCGGTVIEAPRGVIQRVYTIEGESSCRQIDYEVLPSYEDWRDQNGRQQRFTEPPNVGFPVLPSRFWKYPEADSPRRSRATLGWYVVHNNKVWVTPHIQDFELLVVEWNGIKRHWGEADPLSKFWLDEEEEAVDPTIRKALVSYILSEHLRLYGCDLQGAVTEMLVFDAAKINLAHDCWLRVQPKLVRSARMPYRRTPPDLATVEEDNTLRFAYISDYGHPDNGTFPTQVADMVKSWNPSFIVTGGDNQYGGPPGDYAAKVGSLYGDFITDRVETNRFWPAMGNHDWLEAGLQAFLDFFALPNNGRYYQVHKSPVEFFILDSDQHEPDGFTSTSKQGEWLRIRLRNSQAFWKVVIAQDAPYTSGTDRPGNTWMRWPLKDWGADILLSGDTHGYERFLVQGFPCIVAGMGGAPLITLGGYIDDAEADIRTHARLQGVYGALFGQATCQQLVFQFRGIDGITYDTLTMDRNANGSVTLSAVTHELATPVGFISGPGGGVIVGEPGGPIIIP